MNKVNRQFMQQWNKRLVLAIARSHGSLSQVDIVRKSGLSAGAVVNITRQLRKDRFLQQVGKGRSIGGRCPVILKFNSSAKYIVSALCNDRETLVAVVDLTGVIVEKSSFPTRPEAGPAAFLRSFKQHVERLLASKSIPMSRIMALVAGFEGMVDAQSGVLIDCVRLGWKNVPFRDQFVSAFGIDTYVESCTRTAVYSEFVLGKGKPDRNLVYAVLESGIGLSIIHEGRLFHGAHQMEGEIGHTVEDPSGPLCRCGKRGCLEAMASGPAIIEAAREAMVPGMDKMEGKTEEQAFRYVLHAAEQGNKTANDILGKAAMFLGRALAGVINLVDPDKVILAGYMVEKDSEYFFKMIRDAAEARYLGNPLRKLNIVRNTLWHDAAIIGGAMLVCQDVFSLPEWK